MKVRWQTKYSLSSRGAVNFAGRRWGDGVGGVSTSISPLCASDLRSFDYDKWRILRCQFCAHSQCLYAKALVVNVHPTRLNLNAGVQISGIETPLTALVATHWDCQSPLLHRTSLIHLIGPEVKHPLRQCTTPHKDRKAKENTLFNTQLLQSVTCVSLGGKTKPENGY